MVAALKSQAKHERPPLSSDFGKTTAQLNIDFLRAITGTIAIVDVEDRKIFGEIMYNVFHRAGINFRGLMEHCDRDEATVRRWISGDAAPHRAERKRVKEWCIEVLSDEIAYLSELVRNHENRHQRTQ